MPDTLGALLTVCLTIAPGLPLDDRERALMVTEAQAVWQAHRVTIRQDQDASCARLVLVKPDTDARVEDAASDSALGWVPFVAGRPRRVIFLRTSRALTLVAAMSPGTGPDGLTRLLATRFLGRVLAHELGHVLMNSNRHVGKGLMRGHYHPREVLSAPVSSYTLNAAERTLLAGVAGTERRLASR